MTDINTTEAVVIDSRQALATVRVGEAVRDQSGNRYTLTNEGHFVTDFGYVMDVALLGQLATREIGGEGEPEGPLTLEEATMLGDLPVGVGGYVLGLDGILALPSGAHIGTPRGDTVRVATRLGDRWVISDLADGWVDQASGESVRELFEGEWPADWAQVLYLPRP